MSIFAGMIDRDMYDHPGKQTVMTRSIRKYQNRPALTAGQTVTIVRMDFREDQYGVWPRVLVRSDDGERWVNGADIEPLTVESPGRTAMYARMGEIARETLAYRD